MDDGPVPSRPLAEIIQNSGNALNFCPVPAAAVVSVADGSSEVGESSEGSRQRQQHQKQNRRRKVADKFTCQRHSSSLLLRSELKV